MMITMTLMNFASNGTLTVELLLKVDRRNERLSSHFLGLKNLALKGLLSIKKRLHPFLMNESQEHWATDILTLLTPPFSQSSMTIEGNRAVHRGQSSTTVHRRVFLCVVMSL